VSAAFPLYVGDQYRGFRLIGTTPEYIKSVFLSEESGHRIAHGRLFENPFEAVVGADAAIALGLTPGASIQPEHGISESGGEAMVHDHAKTIVVGILPRTNLPLDRAVFTDYRTLAYAHLPSSEIDKHAHETDEEHESHAHAADSIVVKNLDAVLLKLKTPAAALQIAGNVNYPTPDNPMLAMSMRRDPFFSFKTIVMAVVPAMEIAKLVQIIGRADQVLRIISLLVVAISVVGLMVGMYNTMNERREELAIMRALGARRVTLTSIILLEATVISALAALLGLALLQGVLLMLKPVLASDAGLAVLLPYLPPSVWPYLAGFICAGAVSGMIPALKAYGVDPVTTLSGEQ
jgi:putative ABC transport system permease protein